MAAAWKRPLPDIARLEAEFERLVRRPTISLGLHLMEEFSRAGKADRAAQVAGVLRARHVDDVRIGQAELVAYCHAGDLAKVQQVLQDGRGRLRPSSRSVDSLLFRLSNKAMLGRARAALDLVMDHAVPPSPRGIEAVVCAHASHGEYKRAWDDILAPLLRRGARAAELQTHGRDAGVHAPAGLRLPQPTEKTFGVLLRHMSLRGDVSRAMQCLEAVEAPTVSMYRLALMGCVRARDRRTGEALMERMRREGVPADRHIMANMIELYCLSEPAAVRKSKKSRAAAMVGLRAALEILASMQRLRMDVFQDTYRSLLRTAGKRRSALRLLLRHVDEDQQARPSLPLLAPLLVEATKAGLEPEVVEAMGRASGAALHLPSSLYSMLVDRLLDQGKLAPLLPLLEAGGAALPPPLFKRALFGLARHESPDAQALLEALGKFVTENVNTRFAPFFATDAYLRAGKVEQAIETYRSLFDSPERAAQLGSGDAQLLARMLTALADARAEPETASSLDASEAHEHFLELLAFARKHEQGVGRAALSALLRKLAKRAEHQLARGVFSFMMDNHVQPLLPDLASWTDSLYRDGLHQAALQVLKEEAAFADDAGRQLSLHLRRWRSPEAYDYVRLCFPDVPLSSEARRACGVDDDDEA